MQISILGTDGALKANEGDLTSISVLAEDGSYLPNAGNTVLFVTGEDGAYQSNDGTVNALSILGTDGALKPYEEGNSFSILDENGALNVETPIESLFSNGQQGAWYDPSDLSTMFVTAGGPAVTATGDAVGLILDKRLGLALGAELVANPSFDSATGWTLSPGWAIAGGNLVMADIVTDSGQGAYHALSVANGEWVKVEIEVTAISTISFYTELCNDYGGTNTAGSTTLTPTGAGTRVAYLRATASQTGFRIRAQSGTGRSATIASVSVKKIAGNHAFQTTSAWRPTFRDVAGLRYLEFDGVDDNLRAAFTIAQPIDRISALQQVTWTDGEHIFGGHTTNGGVLLQSDGVSPRVNMYSGSHLTAVPALALGVNGVVTERHNGATSRGALNSGAYVTGDAGTEVSGGITIGARYNVANFSNFFLHQLIMRGSATAMTDKEITTCRRLCYLKAGIPFPGEEELAVRLMWNSDQDAQGAWYDPSDLSTMRKRPSVGQLPVSSSGDTVAIILDKSKGLALGTEVITDANLLVAGDGLTRQVFRDGVTNTAVTLGSVVGGTWYKLDYVCTGTPLGSASFRIAGAGLNVLPQVALGLSVPLTGTIYFLASATGTLTLNGDGPGTDVVLDSVSVKSVAGNHAYQTTSASSPIYRDVGGYRYLEFDGVDDYLRATFTIEQPIDRISAIRQVTWTANDQVFGGVTDNSGVLFQYIGTPQLHLFSGGAFLTPTASPAIGVNGVMTERHDGTNARISAGTQAYVTGNSGTVLPGGLTIGASYSAPAGFANLFVHQVIMRGSTTAMTDAEIYTAKKLAAYKSGVLL